MSSVSLSALRGLTATEVNKLEKLGVKTTAALIKAAPTTKKEQELARKAGIPLGRLREAVNRADLVQIKGMGPAKADLFENAGVNSAKELAQRNPTTLAKKLAEYADSHRELNYRAPDVKTVAVLVNRAKSLYATDAAVSSLDEAKTAAATALNAYIDDVLFSNDPRGTSFRTAILDWRDAAGRAQARTQLHAEVAAFVGNGPSPLGSSASESIDESASAFTFTGRLFGLYTELAIRKDTGAAENVLVEID